MSFRLLVCQSVAIILLRCVMIPSRHTLTEHLLDSTTSDFAGGLLLLAGHPQYGLHTKLRHMVLPSNPQPLTWSNICLSKGVGSFRSTSYLLTGKPRSRLACSSLAKGFSSISVYPSIRDLGGTNCSRQQTAPANVIGPLSYHSATMDPSKLPGLGAEGMLPAPPKL